MVNDGVLKATYTIGFGGLAEAVSKMAFGNKLGVTLEDSLAAAELLKPCLLYTSHHVPPSLIT